MVTALIKINQFEIDDSGGSVRDNLGTDTGEGSTRDFLSERDSRLTFTHLPPITNPTAKPALSGWETDDEDNWSDSPTNQPHLLYRHRFAFGRDFREIFPQPKRNLEALALGSDGSRLGDLDDNSGLLIYEELFGVENNAAARDLFIEGTGFVRDKLTGISSISSIRHIKTISSDVDLQQFPFLIEAFPEPFSTKNPIDTDVFVRISNHAHTIASGTISLTLNGAQTENLQINEFFSGLGGFDVSWSNTFNFDYASEVRVRWEFFDTAVPANSLIIDYPFYTVLDLSGPVVSGFSPQDGVHGVGTNSLINFDVEDFGHDVDISTLRLYVNNVLAEGGVSGDLTLERFENGRGYNVSFQFYDSWLYGDLIPVAIFIKDTASPSNESFYTYSFSTEESIAPRLLNLKPYPCTVEIPVGTNVSVDIIDGGHGLDGESLVVSVDEVERSGEIILIPIVHRDE